jgi:alpha-L-arabinofuranosidase
MLEGNTLTSWWDWKDSIGPLKDRPGYSGVWEYQQTHGLGLMEYLLFSEDLDMELGKSYLRVPRTTMPIHLLLRN